MQVVRDFLHRNEVAHVRLAGGGRAKVDVDVLAGGQLLRQLLLAQDLLKVSSVDCSSELNRNLQVTGDELLATKTLIVEFHGFGHFHLKRNRE